MNCCSVLTTSVGLLLAVGCADDPEVERKGGPPLSPIVDPKGGGGGTSAMGGSAGSGGAGQALVPFCSALAVVREKCQRCHGDPLQNEAPVPFLTYEDFHAPYSDSGFEWWQIAVGAVEGGGMPYVALNGPPTNLMPPVEPLTTEEKSTLLSWLKEGALPEGGTDCP